MLDADGKSGAILERVVIDGEPFVLKHIDAANDWIMRQTGDLVGFPITVWETGVVDLAPSCIDHAYVGAAREGRAGAILMRDVAHLLVPSGDAAIPLEQHLRFLEHLATFHASCWGWEDTAGLLPLTNRYCWFSPMALACERALGSRNEVPVIAEQGWARLPQVAPRLAGVVEPLVAAPWTLVDALAREPQTFLAGDWKLGNLGSHSDGRTILLDWALPGAGPPTIELAHYLALNSGRLPAGTAKADTITAYRAALERNGIDTEPWFDRELDLALLGVMVQLGWEKALGDPDELAWWEDRALAGAAYL
jgi:Phosphotransferase enzyme family